MTFNKLVYRYVELAKSNRIDEAEEMVAVYMDSSGFGPAEADEINDALEATGV